MTAPPDRIWVGKKTERTLTGSQIGSFWTERHPLAKTEYVNLDGPTMQAAIAAAEARGLEQGLREAAAYHEAMAADEDALSAKYRGGSNPWFAPVQAAKWHREHHSAILALIPLSPSPVAASRGGDTDNKEPTDE